jgi:hypothetical protein
MTPTIRTRITQALLAAGLVAGAWAAEVTSPQPPARPTAPAVAQAAPTSPAAKPSVSTKEPIRPAPVRNAPPPRAESHPTWAELTPQQQQSLAPLAASWRGLGEPHKRKWLAISENFHSMPEAEQARLHSRMTEWAALSPRQRDAARLNYAEAQKVSPADKRAKWEAYQALPPEEKKRLAAGHQAAKPVPPPTAIAVHPVPQQKLARITRPRKAEPVKPATLPASGPAAAPMPAPAPTAALAPAEANAVVPTPPAASQP